MDFIQIKKDLERIVADLDINKYREYINDLDKIAMIYPDNHYIRLLDITKDVITKDFILSLRGEPFYQSDDVMVFLDEDGFLDTLWMRNEGKNTWRIIPEQIEDDA